MVIKRIGRRIRGLVRRCERCGKRGQELFKLYTFPGSGVEKIKYYCRRCYAKIVSKPEEKI